MKRLRNIQPAFLMLFAAVVLLWLLNIALGSVPISFTDVLSIIISHDTTSSAGLIVWENRLPNSFTALLAGSGLAISGLLLQSLFRNPLAGPSVLGISSGASLGVALVIMLAGGMAVLPFWGVQAVMIGAALSGSLLVLGVLLIALRKINNNVTILILGLMLSYSIGAAVSILQLMASKESLQLFVFWGFGSFSGLSWGQIGILFFIAILSFIFVLPVLKPMNALMMGESYAKSVGVNVSLRRNQIILITGFLSGSITAFCGPVAFIGMAVPHLARWLFKTEDHRVLFPATLLFGAAVALGCDLIARLPGLDWVLPLNAVTALLGAPVVLWIILKNQKIKTIF